MSQPDPNPAPATPQETEAILDNLWIKAELFQHQIDNNHAVDTRRPDTAKDEARAALLQWRDAAVRAELEKLKYVDWEEYSPDGSGINELFDPCIDTYVDDRITALTATRDGRGDSA